MTPSFHFFKLKTWLMALVLQVACFHIAIYLAHRKNLRFTVEPKHYQYRVLPFGVSMTLRMFTRCLAVAAMHLRRKGVHTYSYLDNWLIRGRSQEEITAAMELILSLFSQLELIVKHEKQLLAPLQMIDFIEAMLNS